MVSPEFLLATTARAESQIKLIILFGWFVPIIENSKALHREIVINLVYQLGLSTDDSGKSPGGDYSGFGPQLVEHSFQYSIYKRCVPENNARLNGRGRVLGNDALRRYELNPE